MAQLPNVLFQREYNRRWISYNEEELKCLNRAIKRNMKTVTLPSNDDKKKITVHFEKMIQKNSVSGFEQRLRCVLFNARTYVTWSWKDDYNNWISFMPRAAILLEIAYGKKLKTIEFFIKDSYEFKLDEFIQINQETQYTRPFTRDQIDVTLPTSNFSSQMLADISYCQNYIERMSNEDFDRVKAEVFNLPFSPPFGTSKSGISSTPVPSEIISALSAEAQASSSVQNVTSVSVDPDCPKADQYHVYADENNVYNATLNFTNVIDNNNKFFIIQLLKQKKCNKYAVWFHWGRLGYKGQNNLISCASNLEEAKSVFEKKFFDKTGNMWSERDNFERKRNKYDLVHFDLNTGESPQSTSAVSKLDIKIQELLGIICNKSNLEEAAKELCFDAKNTPLGKIQAKQILEGYAALNKISEILQKQKLIRPELIEACNNFYTKIPHDFGRKTPPILSTMHQVKEKLNMLEDLSQICLALDVLDSSADSSQHVIDKYYKRLECNITPLDCSSDTFQVLKKCLEETHGSTHSAYTMELVDAYMCEKTEESVLFKDKGNMKLLWHGSRLSNWIGILKNGLRIAPPEAPSTGYMFGKGVYFADCSSKSANYCFATKKNNEGLLLLSEVSLGNSLTAFEAEDYSILPADFHSVFAPGQKQPKDFKKTILSSEALVPVGPLEENDSDNVQRTLIYNEYIVYDIHQVKLKYLLKIRFHF